MDFFKDIWETYNERIKSPFIFSFLLSWTLCNWLLVYSLFSFPESYTYYDKINFIDTYVVNHKNYNLFWKPLWTSAVATAIYIVCSGLYLIMFTFYKTTVKTWIFGFTDKGDNVSRTYFLDVQSRYLAVREENKTIRKDLLTAEKQVTELNKRASDWLIKDFDLSDKLSVEQKKNSDLESDIRELNKDMVFQKQSLERFDAIFKNQKPWHFIRKDGSNTITGESLMFEDEGKVRDMDTHKIKYEIEDIFTTRDNIVTSFVLRNTTNRTYKTIFYMVEYSNGYYKGFTTIGNSRDDVRITQQGIDRQLSEFFK
jgi:hypothetical protein